MFLKAFKESSNQKYVNKLLSQPRTSVHSKKVVTVGVVSNVDEFNNFEAFRTLFRDFGLHSPRHKIIGFIADDKFEDSQWESYFSPKDFGWKGKIKAIDLQEFIDEPFDVLICYYKTRNLYLDWITASSKANLKIGFSREDERLFDLIFEMNPLVFDTFKVELKKYLNILNKL